MKIPYLLLLQYFYITLYEPGTHKPPVYMKLISLENFNFFSHPESVRVWGKRNSHKFGVNINCFYS